MNKSSPNTSPLSSENTISSNIAQPPPQAVERGPAARRRPRAAREAYSLYVERVAEGANDPRRGPSRPPPIERRRWALIIALRRSELLRVTHVGPRARLDAGHHLRDVVAVVVHPLVQDVVHGECAHLGVLAALGEVGLVEALDELETHLAEPDELAKQDGGIALPVPPIARHLLLVPLLERAAVLRDDEADPAGKTPLLGL